MTASENIWMCFCSSEIDAEEAFRRINKLLAASPSSKEKAALMDLSAKILDTEVPMGLRDPEAEKVFWSRTKHGDED